MAATEPGDVRGERRWWRAVLLVAPALVFVGLLVVPTLSKGGPPRPGDVAPDFEAELLRGGGTLASSDLKGRPVLLNFWASWCGPCKDEAPLLRDAYEIYGDRVAFVGVDIRDARSDAVAFIDRYGIEYPSVRDEDLSIYDDYGLTGQPESFFIDSDGVIVEHVPGPLFEDDLLRLLDILVARG